MRKKKPFKCCWNCYKSWIPYSHPSENTPEHNVMIRSCCLSPGKKENPYKQHTCPYFEFPDNGMVCFGHEITKEEAQKLNNMSAAELVHYWYGI